MKKRKIIIISIAILLALVVAALVCVVVFNGTKERKVMSETFMITIEKGDEQLYFDNNIKAAYCHAAYRVTESRYEEIFTEMQKAGYKEREIATAKDFAWIPHDELLKAYRLIEGEVAPDTNYVCKYIYVTESKDGCVELYFVERIEMQAKENFYY